MRRMINVYIPPHSYVGTVIENVDEVFRHWALKDLDYKALNLLCEQEHLRVIDLYKGILENESGYFVCKDAISSSVKTLLLGYLYKKKGEPVLLNADSCSEQHFSILFDLVDNSCVSLELSHSGGYIPKDLNYKFNLNNVETVCSTNDLRGLVGIKIERTKKEISCIDVVKTTGINSVGTLSEEERECIDYAMELGLLGTFDDYVSDDADYEERKRQDISDALKYIECGKALPKDLLERILNYKRDAESNRV